MKQTKVDIQIGDWFDIPLPSGHAVGLVSRLNVKIGTAFCYFFGPRRKNAWTDKQVANLEPNGAALLARVSILGFSHGEWMKIGSEADFDEKRWTMPPFLAGLPGEGFVPGMTKVRYSDDFTKQQWAKAKPSDITLPDDSDVGYIALERKLDEIL